jgi:hypothetical protein
MRCAGLIGWFTIFRGNRRPPSSGSDSQPGSSWQPQAIQLTQAPDFRGFFLAGFSRAWHFLATRSSKGRKDPVKYATVKIDEKNKTVDVTVKLNYVNGGVPIQQFNELVTLANAGVANYWGDGKSKWCRFHRECHCHTV